MENNTEQRKKGLDEKFCSECGEIIKLAAEICPKCGVRQKTNLTVNKGVLLLLTFFLGGIGAHKFYLGKPVQGILYLLFCWTFIPSFIAFIEFLIYAFSSNESLSKLQSGEGSSTGCFVCFGFFFGLILIGILTTMAIPKFFGPTTKARVSECKPVLKEIYTLQKAYKMKKTEYAENSELIGFEPPYGSTRFTYKVSYFPFGIKNGFLGIATLKEDIGKIPAGTNVCIDKESVMYTDNYAMKDNLNLSSEVTDLCNIEIIAKTVNYINYDGPDLDQVINY